MKKAEATGAANKRSEGAPALRLEGELSIYRAAELKPLMLSALEATSSSAPSVASGPSPSAPTFDLSEVTEIDTAGVQLLLLARREAAARGASLELVAASPAVRNAFKLLELDSHLAAA